MSASELEQAILKQLKSSPPGVEVGIWIGHSDGRTIFATNADQVLPTASSIKVALLIELFAAFETQLDSPPPGTGEIFADRKHPAFAHYTEDQFAEVKRELAEATVLDIGWNMIHTTKVSNRVYNGASNLAIALLGGPQQATDKIRSRHPSLETLVVNRYMLAPRDQQGDNMATPRELGVVLSKLARKDFAELEPGTIDRIQEILRDTRNDQRKSFRKGGSLSSYPLTKVASGWDETPNETLVFAIMGQVQEVKPEDETRQAYQRLALLVSALQTQIERQVQPIEADVLLKGGMLYLGDGEPPVVGDVAIKDNQIVGVGTFPIGKSKLRIDCDGLAISPGFIDLHNHSDRTILDPETRSGSCYLTQGCTTIVTGNCGSGPINVVDYYDKADENGIGINVAHLLPQGSLRSRVIGSNNRKASDTQIEEMQALAEKAMTEGAWGMSTGLIYVPGSFADTDELVAIAKVISRHGGIYASHMRGEGADLLESVDELLTIGRQAEIPVHISHFKSIGKDSWGLIRVAIKNVEAAQQEGLKVTADQYPYSASSTSLSATFIPAWARSGSRDERLTRMRAETDEGERVRKAIKGKLERTDNGHRIQIASCAKHPQWAGRRLDEIAAELQITPLELVLEIEEEGGASVVNHSINEEDIRYVMTMPWVATASDGSSKIPSGDVPHPRSYGTFPRKIGYYSVREQCVPLAQAVRSSTGLPADILGMEDRGYLRVGMVADIAVWKAEDLIDKATYTKPHQYCEGVRYLLVNGMLAIHEGHLTGALGGKALRHASTAP